MSKKHKYYESERKSGLIIFFIKFIDLWVDLFAFFFKKQGKRTSSQDILISSFGHLGDGLMISYTFPLIKNKYPDAKIDLLVGDWCKPIFENNPYVNDVIVINHFFTNRKTISSLKKLVVHFQTTMSAYKALKHKQYAYSFDVRYTTATSHYFTHFLNVGKRVGFGSAGFGGLLDSELPLPPLNMHLLEIVGLLFREADMKLELSEIIPYFSLKTSEEVTQSKFQTFSLENDYAVIFPETGEPLRAISFDFWEKVVYELSTLFEGNILVIGQNNETDLWAKTLKEKYGEKVFVKTNGLNLPDLIIVTAKAKIALTLESFPAHLGSIFTQTVSLFKDGAGFTYFPIAKYKSVVIHNDLQSQNSPSLPHVYNVYVKDIEGAVSMEHIRKSILEL